MPFFITTYHYAADSTEARDTHRPAHRAYLGEVSDRGGLLISGPFVGGPDGAVLIFEAASEADVSALTDADPFVVEGLVDEITVREWLPAAGRLSTHV
jgi:uncharacterized protein